MKRLCLALLASLGLAGGVCQAKSPFNVDFFVGWEGCYRPMEWTPVEVQVNPVADELAAPFAGMVVVSAQQDELNKLNVVHRFVLTPDVPAYVPLVTKFAYAVSKCDVSILNEGSRLVWDNEYNMWGDSGRGGMLTAITENDLLLGLIGSGKFELASLDEKSLCVHENASGRPRGPLSLGDVYVKRKLPRVAPWDWTGFASLDLLILRDPDWSSFNSYQVKAITDWVSNGGKVLLVTGKNNLPRKHGLAEMLPFEIQPAEERQLDFGTLAELHLDAGLEKVVLSPLVLKNGEQLYKSNSSSLKDSVFASAPVGFGRVAVLCFDPVGLSPRQEVKAHQFWVGVIRRALNDDDDAEIELRADEVSSDLRNHGRSVRHYGGRVGETGTGMVRTLRYCENPDEIGGDDEGRMYYRFDVGAGQRSLNVIMEHLQNIAALRPLSIWWVILLLVTLAIVLGPLDYKVLKRWGRLPMTWLTCAVWISLFTVGAYYGVQFIRGGDMQVRAVSAMDGIQGTRHKWCTTYAGLFAPASDDYKLSGMGEQEWWSGMTASEEMVYYHRSMSGSRDINCFQHDGANLPYSVPINIWSMQCLMTESPVEQFPFTAQVERQGNDIVIDITNHAGSDIESGRVLFAGGVGLSIEAVPANSSRHFSGRKRTMRRDDHENFGESNSGPVYHATGTRNRTDGIEAYLANGAAVVSVRYAQAPLPFSVEDERYQRDHIRLVRQVVFPTQ